MSGFEFDAPELRDPVWTAAFESLVQRAVRAQSAALEAMCEAALVSGKYGVLVEGSKITLTEDVPFGEIYYAPPL